MHPQEVLKSLENKGVEKIKRLKAERLKTSVFRLTVFLLGASGIYFFWEIGWLVLLIFVATTALFLFLVKRHQLLKNRLDHERTFADLVIAEGDMLEGSWANVNDSDAFKNPDHPFVNDLNIFGYKSIYSFLNRTQSNFARSRMASQLGRPELNIDELLSMQAGYQELASEPEFMFRVLSDAKRTGAETDLIQRLKIWLSQDQNSRLQKLEPVIRYLIPALMIGVGLCWWLKLIPTGLLVLVALVPATLVGRKLKYHQSVFESFSDLFKTVDAFKDVLARIQDQNFDSTFLKDKVDSANLANSVSALSELGKIQSAIDSRNNILVAFLLNIFIVYDYQCFFRIQKWKKNHADELIAWLELCVEFEVLSSFGIYVFGHPEYNFPEFVECDRIEILNGRHVLMNDQAVPNDLLLDQSSVNIITGANMAGKSTFLRMVGTSMVLAMQGLPVYADKMSFKPRELFTSMLASDSLGDNESYFFNELKRLRFLMDKLEAGKPQFVILDEILKGTNSIDKAEGSWAFVERLLEFNVKGLVATHDLSLCNLSSKHSQIENRKFEVYIKDDELEFPYKMEEGVCEHMNASFLLKKMGLVKEQ